MGALAPAEAAHQVDDEQDKENQPERAAAHSGTAEVEAATTEKENQKNNEKHGIHRRYGPIGSRVVPQTPSEEHIALSGECLISL